MATSLTEITQGIGDPHKRPSDSSGPDFTSYRVKAWIVCGVFLIELGVYALSSPGRIDIIPLHVTDRNAILADFR
jgi:hypothetical protein